MPSGSGEQLWDPVVRVLHWALVLSFATAWGLGKFGPDQMTLHFYAGYTVAAIVVLRVLWGFVGPQTARFASFVKGPGAVLRYARHLPDRKPSNTWGHNPVGALFVVGVLLVLALQILSGLFADPEDYINVGPLAQYVSSDITRKALSLHEPLSTLLLVMVIAHIAAIGFYRRWKGEDLVTPMITGRKKG
ncbi:cytochrome b/b6 domain-containing protein [Salipiger sp. P9]|uniref:cytochrome b/b6 domain-containing protein n=1 Tax=Salipiger pentaromativorans TaxID=2943193 RepID=UPI00215864CC|nr:cytochrome b/b6 domain-containing protein [Salipiger pentaromativorans]MCR8549759.1 cytochrome b/b6 domain-containing protein [Salipiger pentaromativorans]